MSVTMLSFTRLIKVVSRQRAHWRGSVKLLSLLLFQMPFLPVLQYPLLPPSPRPPSRLPPSNMPLSTKFRKQTPYWRLS